MDNKIDRTTLEKLITLAANMENLVSKVELMDKKLDETMTMDTNLVKSESKLCKDIHFFENTEACPTCQHLGRAFDRATGLCVDCWRVVVLMPSALKTREPPPPGDTMPDGG